MIVKGEFEAAVRNKTYGSVARFVVVQGRINSPPLISKSTLIKLGMIQNEEDGSFAQEIEMRIQCQRSKQLQKTEIGVLESRKYLTGTAKCLMALGR